METVVRNTATHKFFAGEDKGVIFWARWPRENNFLSPWIYGGHVPPDNDLKYLQGKGFSVEVIAKPTRGK